VSFLSALVDTIVAFLLQHVLRYRKDVITTNLTSSLELSQKAELEDAISKNYRFLAKILRQILVHPSRRLLQKRLKLLPSPELDQWLLEGKSVLVTFGHVGNWEWAGSFIGLTYPDQVGALFKKIKSGYINRLMLRRRNTHVNYLIEIGQIGELLRLIRKKPLLVLMIADQNPGSDQGIIWARFLGRDTAFVNGPETLAMRYQLPVVYLKIDSVEKGNYQLSCVPIYDGKEVVEAGIVTQRFANQLESNIRNNGMEWLWSHKRWKRNRVNS
jgi:KDO2-lipid IV(A) lauroyltransferase